MDGRGRCGLKRHGKALLVQAGADSGSSDEKFRWGSKLYRFAAVAL